MTLGMHRFGPVSGLPVVLLHGFPLDFRMWEAVIAELPEVPVIAVDAPGFGISPLPEGEPSLSVYADLLAESLAEENVSSAVIVGLSMGGYAAMALAESRPELFAGIGLLDTKAGADPEAAKQNRLAVADAAEGEDGSGAVAPMIDAVLGATTHAERPEVVEVLRTWLAEAPPAGIAWGQRAMAARPDRHAALEKLDVPGLVLRGDEDDMSPADAAQQMADALGDDTELVTIAGAGHMTAMETPDPVALAIRRLYERVRAG
ncbi:MAG: alpha/beta hydrolase [Propionibacterium sp.]|nr:alpha/beta hydrolase [Propionibacterium sp.]